MEDLFSAADFVWTIRMRRDEPEAFFAPRENGGQLLERKNHWLDTAPELCLARCELTDRLVAEVWSLAEDWGHVSKARTRTLEELGRQWEADFILLDEETFVLAGGCVCFPSSWNLQASTGKSLAHAHGLVPGLTRQIGDQIDRFLRRLPPGKAFLRENWGLTRTDQLNYHPALQRPRLSGAESLSEIFLRIEHQSFVRLPSGVLLGIRIEPVPLDRLVAEAPEAARRLARQLATMPEEVAVYKGLERTAKLTAKLTAGRIRDELSGTPG